MNSQVKVRPSAAGGRQNLTNRQEGLQSLRGRFLYKSFDAVMTARLRPKGSARTNLAALLNPNKANYDRVAAIAHLIDRLVPGAMTAFIRLLIRDSKFPFRDVSLVPLGYGSGSTVFRLPGRDCDHVLKIYRRSLGKRSRPLMALTAEFKEKYDTVSAWYNGAVQLVPPAQFLILHGPILAGPAAAVLQPYIEGEIKDLFCDFSDAQLLAMMADDPDFRRQFLFFAQQTVRIWAEQGMCLDMLGYGNVAMIENETGTGCRLLIIDNGIFRLEEIRKKSPRAFARLEQYLSRLRSLLVRLSSPAIQQQAD